MYETRNSNNRYMVEKFSKFDFDVKRKIGFALKKLESKFDMHIISALF